MGIFSDIFTIARWEVKKSFSTMGRNVLPLAIILFILLILATGFVARSGMHLQDGMYLIATDDRELGSLLASDGRFTVFIEDGSALISERSAFDLIIVNGTVSQPFTDRGRAALTTLSRDYSQYLTSVYSREPDLFAAYPLWIDLQYVKSELDFQATQSGQYISVRQRSTEPPVPQGPVVQVTPPPAAIPYTADELRRDLQQETGKNDQIARYTSLFTQEPSYSSLKTPSQLTPTLPFDSIIFVFVFIFPLYFTSQFFMMSVMNERIGRKGEILLSGPLHPLVIIAGKMLPYFAGMIAASTVVIFTARASLLILLPLFPVILFFLAAALLIGMLSRSFKELSFISIFFSTIATSYLFFPSIFANVHVISLVSPLTLVILEVQGTGFTAMDYLYSTSLIYAASAVLLYIGAVNFNAERLYRAERGAGAGAMPAAESRPTAFLRRVYELVYAPQDRLVERFAERRLRGLPPAARAAYHDRATVTVMANLGMSTQLAAFGLCLALGRPTMFVWIVLAELGLVAGLALRRELRLRGFVHRPEEAL